MNISIDLSKLQKQIVSFMDHVDNVLQFYENDELDKYLQKKDITDNDKINEMYAYREELISAKSESDYLFCFLKYNLGDGSFRFEQTNISGEDFKYYSDQCDFQLLQLEAEIEILENKQGERYFRENSFTGIKKKRTNSDKQTQDQIRQKQTLQLILKASENYLFEKNDSAIGEAVHYLTGKKFVAENAAEDVRDKGKTGFSYPVYESALSNLEKIIADIKQEMKKKLPPGK